MACKIYAHVDDVGKQAFTVPLQIPRPEDSNFGTAKQELISQYSEAFPNEDPLDYNTYCFWNQDSCPIPDRASVAVFAWEHNDFFLRPLPEGAASASALAASQKKRGELSYYYAHDRASQSLVSRPPATVAAGVSSSVATAAKPEPLNVSPSVTGAGRFNAKQSPFGTNINLYQTITNYTWEDHDSNMVKVLVPLDGVGKLPPGQICSSFNVRAFELLIGDYNGKNLRFACNKTHGEMIPSECKHVVRANRINLILRKAKEKDIWFDLFKKRAIGDDDDP